MIPKWQLAKVKRCNNAPLLVGHLIWVKYGPPTMKEGVNLITGEAINPSICYRMNVVSENNKHCIITADCVELLNEYSEEDVEFIPQELFIKQFQVSTGSVS